VTVTIEVGDRIPDVAVRVPGAEGPRAVRTGTLLGTGRAIVFGVPGAFTPTCNDYHLPSYLILHDQLEAKGVDMVACVSVNDAYVMGAWGLALGVGDQVVLVADGNAEFTRALGLEMDGSAFGLGTRSKRYALVVDDGVVTSVAVEPGPGLSVSAADAVLASL
jgi:peroxiredoxin